MRTHRLLLVCSLLILIVLAGCTVEYRTDVQNDGAGQMSMAVGFTAQEASDLNELTGGSTTNFCQEMWADASSDLPPNAAIREEQRGEETYCIVEFSFASLAELRTIYTDQSLTVNRLEIVDERFYYDVSIDLSDADTIGIPMNMTWVVTMPGTVGSNNASTVSGQTLTWNLVVGQVNNMRAESSLSSSVIWWVLGGLGCLCLLVAVVAGVVGLVLYLRKKKKS